MFVIDDWLLRRVFQPIVDWLSPWCGRFQIARCCVHAAMVLLIPLPIEYFTFSSWPLGGAVVGANAILAFIWWQRTKLWRWTERAEELGHIMPPTLVEAVSRIAALVVYTMIDTVYFLPPIRFGSISQVVAFATFVIALYFAGCNPGAPRQRRVSQWAPSPA